MFFGEIFCSSLVAYRHISRHICFNLLRGLFHFPCMAYRHVARHICFNLLRGLFHFPSMAYRHVVRHICFYFASQSFVIHALHRRTAFGACQLDVSGFRKSLVIHAHRARPDCRVAKDCEANYFQCAEWNGDMPLPSSKGLRSKQYPMSRTKWWYASS